MNTKPKKSRRGSFFVQCTKECDLPFMKKLLSGMTIHKKSYNQVAHAFTYDATSPLFAEISEDELIPFYLIKEEGDTLVAEDVSFKQIK